MDLRIGKCRLLARKNSEKNFKIMDILWSQQNIKAQLQITADKGIRAECVKLNGQRISPKLDICSTIVDLVSQEKL